LRILQVNKLYHPTIGGVETVVRDIAEGLSGRVDMTVLVCGANGAAGEEVIRGVRVVRAKSYGVIMSLPISLDFFRKFRALSRQADIIQIHAPFPLADLALWLFDCQARVAVWWHSDIVRQKLFSRPLRPFIHHTLRRADAIIAATGGHALASAFLPEYKDKCQIIPFGLNFADYPEPVDKSFLTARLNDKTSVKLLFVGRLVYYKGAQVLLDAMGWVRGVELFIVGDGKLRAQLERGARERDLSAVTHFLGHLPRDELLAAFYDCDLFALPSVANSEAFGIVQLEAMRYGKPVINTDLPTGVPYVSVDGETGITARAGSATSLAKAIMTLVNDKALRETYGRAAEARARERFDRRGMLDSLYNVYERLTSH
jgi:rhamnosyl/mannosyltransferase